MPGDIFGKAGAHDLTENAIQGMVEEEIAGHRKEESALPIIKLKLPVDQPTVTIHKPEASKPKTPSESVFKIVGAQQLAVSAKTMQPTVKLPPTLSDSQKMRKAFRFRRYGMQIRQDTVIRPSKPLPSVKPEDLKKLKWFRFKKENLGTELLVPALLVFLVFSWMPIIKTFAISMRKYETISKSVFIGLDNFMRIAADPAFWDAFMHSAVISVVVIVVGTWLPLLLALYVNEMRRGSSLMKILYFIPFLTPAVPAATLWKWMYNQGFGLINSFLSIFTPEPVSIGWLTDPNLVLFSIALVFIWKNTGWAMLIYLAGLYNVPQVLYEDSAMHGAGIICKIRNVVLPYLKPIITAVIFIQAVSGMQVFTEVYIMTNGGPAGSSEVIATYIYKKAFLYMDIGYASGVAVFFFFILVSLTLARMATSALGRKG